MSNFTFADIIRLAWVHRQGYAPLSHRSLVDGCTSPSNWYPPESWISGTVTLLSAAVDIKCNCDCVYAVAGTGPESSFKPYANGARHPAVYLLATPPLLVAVPPSPPSLDGCAPPTNSYSSASSATVTLLSVDIKCNCDCVYAVAGTSRVQLQAAR